MNKLKVRRIVRDNLAPIVVGIGFLILWEAIVRAFKIPPYLLPSPSRIWESFLQNAPSLLAAMAMTMSVTLVAFFLSTILGLIIAFLFVLSPLFERCFLPYVILLQVTPVVAIAPLIIILVNNTQVAMIICATVVAFFPIVSNTTIGLRSADPGLLAYFRMNKAGTMTTLWRLRVPSALPYFLGGLRISAGLSLIGAVVAEFVAGTGGSSAGLAFEVLQSGFQLAIPRMFAALALIAILGIALYCAMLLVSARLLSRWDPTRGR